MRYGSIDDLQLFSCNNWTGQYSSQNIHTKMKSSLKRKLEMLGERFDSQNHGRFLFPEKNKDGFMQLQTALDKLTINIEGSKIIFRPREKPVEAPVLSMKSAYAEIYNEKYGSQHGQTGEILYSTIPIQDPYPVTVDYIL